MDNLAVNYSLLSNEGISKQDLEKTLAIYSDSKIEDNTWVLNKYRPDTNYRIRSIYFNKITSPLLLDCVKEFAIILLLQGYSIPTINGYLTGINEFIALTNINKLTDITKQDIEKAYNSIYNSTLKLKTKAVKWTRLTNFFEFLKESEIVKWMNAYNTPSSTAIKIKEKYIPDEAAKKMDFVFLKEDNIPIQYKALYWTLRLYPNRITEVLSMKTDCLKQISEKVYTITIPTTKQAGPYNTGALKIIQILNEGIGKEYIDIMSKMIEYRKSIADVVDDNFIFYSPTYKLLDNHEYKIHKSQNTLLNSGRAYEILNRTISDYGITDENGNPISITTHQFRHNAITDRILSGYFRPIDLMSLTAHHSTSMIESCYYHGEVKEVSTGPVVFHGKVINTDNPGRIEKLLARPYAYEIHNLGICSDSRDCAKDKYSCYRCKYIVPDVKNLPYFLEQLDVWRKKLDLAKKTQNKDYYELCEDRLDAFQSIINRINEALEKEGNNNEEK